MKIIFITGASASGKTSLAEKTQEALQRAGKSAELIVMDSYFKEIPDDREINEYRETTNFDRLDMYETELLITDILALNGGQPISNYHFEFSTNKRAVKGVIQPPEFLIVEGLFAMQIANRFDKEDVDKMTVFVETSSYKTIVRRRVERDFRTRNREEKIVRNCEKQYVGVAYFDQIVRGMREACLSVVNDDPIEGQPHPLDKGVVDILSTLGIEDCCINSTTHVNENNLGFGI